MMQDIIHVHDGREGRNHLSSDSSVDSFFSGLHGVSVSVSLIGASAAGGFGQSINWVVRR